MMYAEIDEALFRHLRVFADAENIETAWPNIGFDFDDLDRYLDVSVLNSPAETVGVNSVSRVPGVFQVSVYARDGVGVVGSKEIADRLISHFSRGTSLDAGDCSVEITLQAYVSPVQIGGGWLNLPVSIPFLVLR